MGVYRDHVLPRLSNVLLGGTRIEPMRARVAGGLRGTVLEIGFGTGLNVPHYPADVTRVLAVEPSLVSRKLAAGRIAAGAVPVEFVGLDAQRLPLDAGSVDHVLTTWTMCTIPDIATALAEISRVLRPGGALHFLEHGLSPDPDIARRQDRLNPLHRRLFGGCHLDRDIGRAVRESGLVVDRLSTYYLENLRATGYIYEGVAAKP